MIRLWSAISQGCGYWVPLSPPDGLNQSERHGIVINFPIKRNKGYTTYFMYLDTLTVTQLQFLHFQILHLHSQSPFTTQLDALMYPFPVCLYYVLGYYSAFYFIRLTSTVYGAQHPNIKFNLLASTLKISRHFKILLTILETYPLNMQDVYTKFHFNRWGIFEQNSVTCTQS